MKKIKNQSKSCKINDIKITNDTISGRGGLTFILRYIEKIGFFDIIDSKLGYLQKSTKGLAVALIIKQIVAHFIDGTFKSVSSFNVLRNDSGYAAVLEIPNKDMAGSDMVKRFLMKFFGYRATIFRTVLLQLFIWRLKNENPSVILLDMDTMCLDNDTAKVREGCNVTYKKKKGFQPLHVSWGPFIVDCIFRSGEKHSNHGDDVKKMLKKVVTLIRSKYRKDASIIVTFDSGFMDDNNFTWLEDELKIHYVCMGKLYAPVKEYAEKARDNKALKSFAGKSKTWNYVEMGSRLKSWDRFRRAIYTTMTCENEQLLLDFVCKDSIIYTNIGSSKLLDEQLIKNSNESWLCSEKIISLAHGRGESELNHRSIKEFMGTEHLPFKRFYMNAAWYYLKLISSFLMESFRQDIVSDILPKRCFPNTFRRTIIDIAVKVVTHSKRITLKVTQDIKERLDVFSLWSKCNNPIPIPLL